MGALKRTHEGGLELEGRAIEEGRVIELWLSGVWTKGWIRPSEGLGPIFVSESGEQSVVGLEGAAARFPASGVPASGLEEAYIELITAAGHAAAALRLIQQEGEWLPGKPGTRTLERLLNALYVVRERRAQAQAVPA